MNDFEVNIENYIDYYDNERHLFFNGIEWIKKGWLNKSEFLEICLWKSRRPKRLYEQNSDYDIKEFTRKAFLESDEKNKIDILVNLRGVSVPTASAILSVTNSVKYPIIDVRCVQTLNDIKYITWRNINSSNWVKYLVIIRELATKHNKTAREVEKGLFAYNKLKLDKQYRNLYKY